jgi:hypothetical protein
MGELPAMVVGESAEPVAADTFVGRIHVEWDSSAPVTPPWQMPFFIEFVVFRARHTDYAEWARFWIAALQRIETEGGNPRPIKWKIRLQKWDEMLELENMRMLDILGDNGNTNKNKIFAIASMMDWTDIDKEKAAECRFLLMRVGAMYLSSYQPSSMHLFALLGRRGASGVETIRQVLEMHAHAHEWQLDLAGDILLELFRRQRSEIILADEIYRNDGGAVVLCPE